MAGQAVDNRLVKRRHALTETRQRPGLSLPSRTEEKIRTELGNLYLAVTFDEDDRPFQVFGWIG